MHAGITVTVFIVVHDGDGHLDGEMAMEGVVICSYGTFRNIWGAAAPRDSAAEEGNYSRDEATAGNDGWNGEMRWSSWKIPQIWWLMP